MSSSSMELIVATFENEVTADQALLELKKEQKSKKIDIQDIAVIVRDDENKLHIKETEDVEGGKGAVYGGVIGGILGLIGGPAGVALGGAAGAVVGGLAAKKIDAGIPDDRLKKIGEALQPGTSMIMIIIDGRWEADVNRHLKELGGKVLSEPLDAGLFRK